MRVYGRTPPDEFGNRVWKVIETADNGDNTQVYLTWLAQALMLSLGESPFWGDWGIPGYASVAQQIAPDAYILRTQQRFSKYFASLIVLRIQGPPMDPTYQINALLPNGARITETVVPI